MDEEEIENNKGNYFDFLDPLASPYFRMRAVKRLFIHKIRNQKTLLESNNINK